METDVEYATLNPIPQAWFASKGACSDSEPATPEEVAALKSYLLRNRDTDHDDEDNRTEPMAAAAAKALLTNNMDESRTSLDNKMFRLAALLISVILEFPAYDLAVLRLVDAIRDVPSEAVGLSDAQKAKDPNWAKFTRFDDFDVFFDAQRRSSWAYRAEPDEDDEDPRDCHRRWANVNAYLAYSCVYHEVSTQSLELRYGISIVTHALGGQPGPEIHKNESVEGFIPAADIPAAVAWIIVAGRTILDYVASVQVPVEADVATSQPSKSIEQLGFKDWTLWERRLWDFHVSPELDDETRFRAWRGWEKMGRLNRERS